MLSEQQISAAQVGYSISETQGDIDISNALVALENAKLNLDTIKKEIDLES
jgi:hypothetical protein